jgi:hypothetical protein
MATKTNTHPTAATTVFGDARTIVRRISGNGGTVTFGGPSKDAVRMFDNDVVILKGETASAMASRIVDKSIESAGELKLLLPPSYMNEVPHFAPAGLAVAFAFQEAVKNNDHELAGAVKSVFSLDDRIAKSLVLGTMVEVMRDAVESEDRAKFDLMVSTYNLGAEDLSPVANRVYMQYFEGGPRRSMDMLHALSDANSGAEGLLRTDTDPEPEIRANLKYFIPFGDMLRHGSPA